MKIIKSFTDENGQEVLVQGAGTNYDVDLNSLAIGEGTVAAGEDQFVFGRYNIADSSKVEVVGGGYTEQGQGQEQTDITEIMKTINSLEVGSEITLSPHPISMSGETKLVKIGNTLEEALVYVKGLFAESGSLLKSVTMESDTYSQEDLCGFFTYPNVKTFYTSFTVWVVPDVFVNHVIAITKDGKMLKGSTNSMSKYWVTLSDFYAITIRKVISNEVFVERNIRTLDWMGNEYIANSLAIGKDSKSETNGQLVFGRGNKVDNTKVEIVGNGVDNVTVTYDLSDIESIKNIPIGTELHTNLQVTDWYKNAKLIVMAKTLEELNELGEDIISLGQAGQEGLDDIDIYLYCKYKNLDESSTYRYAYIFKRKDEDQIRIKFTTIGDTKTQFWFAEPLDRGVLFNSLVSGYSSDEVLRTLDWEGNEVLAGELTSKKVNTKSVKWEDDTYSRQIDSQEASLMPKIVEISSQMAEATNPITQNKLNINIPNISETGMLAKSNKFLKLVVNDGKGKTIWGQQYLTDNVITFRNVKTSLIDNVFYETIIEIIYALDLPTASVMHKVADLQTGDIQYYLATSLS